MLPDAPGWWHTDDPMFGPDGCVLFVIDSGIGLVAEVGDEHVPVESFSAWRGRLTDLERDLAESPAVVIHPTVTPS